MQSLYVSKRSKAIISICLVAIGIAKISKKVTRYPKYGCMKEAQEFANNKEIKRIRYIQI